ncbi:hypothetical protein FPV67DRAFT_231636 [Lyophyllum atratum]|nr:hypothetical protein FPV67DRAFT_231636 [Lyophyllum atratum]
MNPSSLPSEELANTLLSQQLSTYNMKFFAFITTSLVAFAGLAAAVEPKLTAAPAEINKRACNYNTPCQIYTLPQGQYCGANGPGGPCKSGYIYECGPNGCCEYGPSSRC